VNGKSSSWLKFNEQVISEELAISSPFLLISNIEVNVSSKLARSSKKLYETDWFFSCHLPNNQLMPATLITECMLQTLVFLIYQVEPHGVERAFITNIDVRVFRKVVPGDLLTLSAKLIFSRRGITNGEVEIFVGDQLTAKGCFRYASPHLMVSPEGVRDKAN